MTRQEQVAIATEKKLRIFNGRGHGKHDRAHFYIAAHSIKDCARLLMEAGGFNRLPVHEVNVFYAKDCWGNSMSEIVPERGVWVCATYNSKPERVI